MTQAKATTIRFVDLCAGLGGFHHALSIAQEESGANGTRKTHFECVLASELDENLRRDYVVNFPDLKDTYKRYFPPRRMERLQVALSESGLAPEADIYDANGCLKAVHGDLSVFFAEGLASLRVWPDSDADNDWVLPEHDLLCAGFPCQPFSKSGSQRGFEDMRGTVFHMIALILRHRRPSMVLLENVGNFDRHDGGNTWHRVKDALEELGYDVVATRHKTSGGPGAPGLLSPHHIGLPHHRERFFILAQHGNGPGWLPRLEGDGVFPTRPSSDFSRHAADREARKRLRAIVGSRRSQDRPQLEKAQLPASRVTCIEHWNRLLQMMRDQDRDQQGTGTWRGSMPSYPIWGYELDPWQWYPAEENPRDWIRRFKALPRERIRLLQRAAKEVTDSSGGAVNLLEHPPRESRAFLADHSLSLEERKQWIHTWPTYARDRDRWPEWKRRFIEQNRDFAVRLWSRLEPIALREWLDDLVEDVPIPSNQKLEWNCKNEVLDLWQHILQFRPSGLRVKRFSHVPALVAMTTTQIPVVPAANNGKRLGDSRAPGRYLLPSEALQLQGFPADWSHPPSRDAAFKAFGNAVHCGLVAEITRRWLLGLGEAEYRLESTLD